DPLRRQLGVPAQQLADALDHQVVGPGLGVHPLLAGLAERRADAVDEHDVLDGAGHRALLEGASDGVAETLCYSPVTTAAASGGAPTVACMASTRIGVVSSTCQ